MSDSALATTFRTHLCGALRDEHVGASVRLGGWVHRARDLGGLVFFDLRDRAGLVQVSVDLSDVTPEVAQIASSLGAETVVLVEGLVVQRPEAMRNAELGTGDVEVRATALRVLAPAETPVIPVARGKGEQLAAEELRLRHRYLDLRRDELQRNLLLRHRLMQTTRRFLSATGFFEIETPMLTKPTPEGARDYLVPSRVHPGEFYALPQSPQIYKQLLMVAGYDRYFQIARCFRDEDLRADRQPEFTQIDIEASFVSAADVQAVVERVLVDLWRTGGVDVAAPFPRLGWKDAMERYGIDKPDLRYGYEIRDLGAQVGMDAAPFVRDAITAGGRLRGIVAAGAALSRKELDALTVIAKAAGAGGLIWARRAAGGLWEGQGVKAIGGEGLASLGGADGDLLLAVVGPDAATSAALHGVRTALTRRAGAAQVTAHAFLWVVDFPLFEIDPASGRHVPAHHPFTAVHPEDRNQLESDPGACRALHYDAVYNGNELGSGSIRITDPEIQRTIFRLLDIPEPEVRRRFGFLLDGLAAGAPPHGGFALGFDRITMLLAGAQSLRDVIAFPKTTTARALFEGAPTTVDPRDLVALHLQARTES